MLFNSPVYILYFLPTAITLYYLLIYFHKAGAAHIWLLLCSLFFYGWWRIGDVPLLLVSIVVNYKFGEFIITNQGRNISRHALILGIIFNLGILIYFKYTNWAVTIYSNLVEQRVDHQKIILPLAISFFTFQQIAYLADCYSKLVTRYKFFNYLMFVTFFPQLIAGPIVHHREMVPQFESNKKAIFNINNIAVGIFIFSLGLFKKVVIADSFADWADAGYDDTVKLYFMDAWIVSLSYTFQLYYDFSGYADMAIGSALFFNIRLPLNFNSPYKADSIRDFWSRWHITLSTWLKMYVYIPLGGNRGRMSSTVSNIFLTFLIGGVWHGAGWTFIIWGALHGVAAGVNRLWRNAGFKLTRMQGVIVTFIFVNTTWVFFRAESLGDAFRVLSGMIGLNGFSTCIQVAKGFGNMPDCSGGSAQHLTQYLLPSSLPFIFLFFFGGLCFCARNSQEISGFSNQSQFTPKPRMGVAAGLLIWTVIFFSIGDTVPSEFLYFNF